MAETVQIVLGANTTGAINAIRNFTSSIHGATQGVQKLAIGLSSLGSNAASITSALGNTATSEAISKWTDLGTSIAFAGKALADIGKGVASILSRTGARGGLWGTAAALGAFAGLQMFETAEANQQREESIKKVQEDNLKLQDAIIKTIELRAKAGAITKDAASLLFDRATDAFKGDANKTFIELVRLNADVNSGIGNRESIKARLALNDLSSSRQGLRPKEELATLRDRVELIKELQRTFSQNTDTADARLVVPGPEASAEELKNYTELLATMKELQQTHERINEIQANGNIFLNDLAATAAGSVTTALSGVADGLTGIILGTRTWAQAMQQTTASILSMVIQMILKFTVLYGLISLLQAVFPGSGFVGKFATFAGFPGKATGGIVGSGIYQVGERGPEYVIDNKTLSRLGTGFFQSLQAGMVPSVAGVPSVAPGGGVGVIGSGGAVPNVTIHMHQDRSAAVRALDSTEGHAFIASIVDGRIQMSRS